MRDEQIERAIDGVLAIADSNFPSPCDVEISAIGKNSASIKLASYEVRGILALAKRARTMRPCPEETARD